MVWAPDGDPLIGVMDAGYADDRTRRKHLIFRYKSRALAAVRGFLEFFPSARNPAVLELGAAEGSTLLEIRRLLGGEGRYLGVELSDSLLAKVPRLPQGVRVIKGDVTGLPASIEDQSFDLVTALAVLEHLDEPILAVREAFRVLRVGGVFVATTPNPWWDAVSTRAGLLKGEYHASDLTLRAMQRLAETAGFSVVRTRPFMFAPVGFLPYLGATLSPALALDLDRTLNRVRIFDRLFVNQLLIARR